MEQQYKILSNDRWSLYVMYPLIWLVLQFFCWIFFNKNSHFSFLPLPPVAFKTVSKMVSSMQRRKKTTKNKRWKKFNYFRGMKATQIPPKQCHWCCCLLSMLSIFNFPSISVLYHSSYFPSLCHPANVQALIHSWLTWSIKFHKIKYNFHVEWMLIIYPFVCCKRSHSWCCLKLL